MKVASHHYHPIVQAGGMAAIEHEHMVNPGREHRHERGPGDDVDLGVSQDDMPVPAAMRGEGHRTPMRAYTTPKRD